MKKSKINYWPTYSLLGVGLIMLFGLGAFIYYDQQTPLTSSLPNKNLATQSATTTINTSGTTTEDTVLNIYPDTQTMSIAGVEVEASIADSWPERIQGLSDTPFLPDHIVKFFVFDSMGEHSIWMKDMNYAIDIIWVDEAGSIVHLVKNATPESYPGMFVPDFPAKYVIETVAGFIDKNQITKGQTVVLPTL